MASKEVGVAASALGFAGAVVTGNPFFIAASGLTLLNGVAGLLRGKKSEAIKGIDLGRNMSDPISSLPIIFGSTRVGAQRVAIATQSDNRYLWAVMALGHGPLSSIGPVYFDDKQVITSGGAATIDSTVIAGSPRDYSLHVGAWFAYGTEDQLTIVPSQRTGSSRTVTGSSIVDASTRQITTSVAHGYTAGVMIEGTGVAGLTNNVGYVISSVTAADTFRVYQPEGTLSGGGGAGGTVDRYQPNLQTDSIFPGGWAGAGKGIAYIVLRLTYDETKFPSGMPRVTVDVTGGGAYDPRTAVAKSITGETTAAGLGAYSSTLDLTVTGHGYGEGDLILVAGTGSTLDGVQRVDRVVDVNTIKLCVDSYTGTLTGGTVTELTSNANPIIAMRQVLKSDLIGVGADDSEIDDTAVETEADYCDEDEYYPVPDATRGATWTNTKNIFEVQISGADTKIVTVVNHGYLAGDIVYIDGTGHAVLDGLFHTILSVPTLGEFKVDALVSSNQIYSVAPFPYAQIVSQQNRFQLGGVVDGNGTVKETLEQIMAACRGSLVWTGGKYTPTIRRVASSVMTLDESVIVGDWRFVVPGQREKFNVVRATYLNPANGYQMDQVEWPPSNRTNTYLTEDQGQLNRADIVLPLVDSRARAAQIAMVLRDESRVAVQVEVTCRESVLKCTVGDRVAITHSTPAWTAQGAWIVGMVPLPDGLVRVGLELYDEDCYDLDDVDDTPYHSLTELPDPLTVTAPTGLSASSFTNRRAFLLSWTASTSGNVHRYDVQHRQNGTTTWYDAQPVDGTLTSVEIDEDFVVGLTYDFQIRSRTAAGGVSGWTTITNQAVGQKPGSPTVSATITETPTVVIALSMTEPLGPSATRGFRYAAGIGSVPSEATVDGTVFIPGTTYTADIGNLGGLLAGQTIYIAAKAYTATGGVGSELSVTAVEVPGSVGPTLEVTATPGASSYSVAWSGTGTVTVSIDGAAYGTPAASPIAVTRHATVDITYNFKCLRNNQTITNSVTVPSLEKDTVTPDLVLIPGTPTATAQPYTVTFSNPSGGTAPTGQARIYNATYAINGGAVKGEADNPQTIASGDTINVLRPATTQTTRGHMTVRASIAGGGIEEITVEVLNQLNLGPTLDVQAAPGAGGGDYVITYSGSGTITYAGNGGSYVTPPASPFNISRHATNDQTYTFKCSKDGQDITNSITVPSLETDTVTPDLTLVNYNPTDAAKSNWFVTAANPAGGTAPTITVTPIQCTFSIYTAAVVFVSGPHSTAQSLTSGQMVSVDRPVSTQTTKASILIRAEISGGGKEEISRTIPAQLNIGPILEVQAYPGATAVDDWTIVYSGTGTITYAIDNGSFTTPPSSPITVTLDGDAHTYTFKCTRDGQTITTPVGIPAVPVDPAVAGFSLVTLSSYFAPNDGGSGTMDIHWSTTGLPSTTTYDVHVDIQSTVNGTVGVQSFLGVTDPYTANITDFYDDSAGTITVVAKLSGDVIATGFFDFNLP